MFDKSLELRYHVSETECSKDTLIYHLELPEPGSLEEVDTFENDK